MWPDQKASNLIIFSFKQEGAWGWEWAACDLGAPCTYVNYSLMLGLLHCWQLSKTSGCACWACHIDIDQESGAVHLHQVYHKLGHSFSETYDMVQKAFGNETMGYTQVKEWFWQFIEVWSSVEGDECSGRPSMMWNHMMIDRVHSVVLDD